MSLDFRLKHVAVLAAAFAFATPAAAQSRASSTQPVTISLDDAIRAAEQKSEAIAIANAGIMRAQGTQMAARSARLPQVSGSLSYQRTLQSQFQEISKKFAPPDSGGAPGDSSGGDLASSPLARIFASENTVLLGLTLNQTLFSGGRITAQNRAAQAGERAARIGLTAAQAQLRLDVASAYYDAVLADRMVAIAESSLVQSERTFRQASLARQVGNVAEFDLLRARVARDNLRPQVIQVRTQRDVAYLRLKQLINLPLDQQLRLTSSIQEGLPQAIPAALRTAEASGARMVPASRILDDAESILDLDRSSAPAVDSILAVVDTSVDARSTVRQARENVEAQEQMLRAARGARLPSIGITSSYQRYNYPLSPGDVSWNNSFPNWTVGVGLSVPIFTGGRIRADQMIAEANLMEARERHEQAREYAALDARLAVAELDQQEAAYLASLGTDEQAARAYRIAEIRYSEGISTQVELSEARILLNQAAANRALAARNLQVARVKLALLKALPLGGVPESAGRQMQQAPAQQRSQQQPQQQQQEGVGSGQQAQGQ
jgi:outer membrane protein